jgi:hypothetical protein
MNFLGVEAGLDFLTSFVAIEFGMRLGFPSQSARPVCVKMSALYSAPWQSTRLASALLFGRSMPHSFALIVWMRTKNSWSDAGRASSEAIFMMP